MLFSLASLAVLAVSFVCSNDVTTRTSHQNPMSGSAVGSKAIEEKSFLDLPSKHVAPDLSSLAGLWPNDQNDGLALQLYDVFSEGSPGLYSYGIENRRYHLLAPTDPSTARTAKKPPSNRPSRPIDHSVQHRHHTSDRRRYLRQMSTTQESFTGTDPASSPSESSRKQESTTKSAEHNAVYRKHYSKPKFSAAEVIARMPSYYSGKKPFWLGPRLRRKTDPRSVLLKRISSPFMPTCKRFSNGPAGLRNAFQLGPKSTFYGNQHCHHIVQKSAKI